MWRPIQSRRPQIDLVRNKDYSFVKGGRSVNTLKGRVVVSYDKPDCFDRYFNDGWTFGTAKLVSLLGEWYLHISMTKKITDTMDESHPTHLVGLDRGLRFLIAAYNE
ncbi:MAG: hypothetical protein LUE86_05790 [Clostridiales bacterium]|nr:hypothetical protein [Clostridiales bacterium]